MPSQSIAVNYITNSGTCSSTSTYIQHPNTSSTSRATNVSQQSITQRIVRNDNHLNENWKSFTSQHQHVYTSENFSKDQLQQVVVFDNGNFRPVIILAPVQNVILHQGVCIPKGSHQQKYVPQKAVAVVTPITQKVVEVVPCSSTLTQVKKGLEAKCIPHKQGHECCIPHPLQKTTNTSALELLHDVAQTDTSQESPSESLGLPQHVEAKGHARAEEHSNHSIRLCSLPLNIVSEKRTEKTLKSQMENWPSSLHEVPVVNKSSDDKETRMDMESSKNVTDLPREWSLQNLHTLINDLEQMQTKHQNNLCFANFQRDIIKLFWNGEYAQLYEASKSNLYSDIMENVRFYFEMRNSVILREFPNEKLKEIASDLPVLKHDSVPPKMSFKSSWLNLNENLVDIDKECYPLSLMTSQSMSKTDKVLVKEQKHLVEAEPEKTKSISKLSDVEWSKDDKVLRLEPKCMDVRTEETTCVIETLGEEKTDLSQSESIDESRNVITLSAPSQETVETNGKNANTNTGMSSNGVQPSQTLRTKSIAVNGLFTTEATNPLNKINNADQDFLAGVKINILSPERARKMFLGALNEGALHSLTDSEKKTMQKCNQQFENEKHMESEMKSDKRKKRILNKMQLSEYCCMAKWFHVLGYRNGGHCRCEQKPVLKHSNTSDSHVTEADPAKYRHPFSKLTDSKMCKLRDNTQVKSGCGSRRLKSSVMLPIQDDDSVDEIKKVEFISNYEDVLKLANAISEQFMDAPLVTCPSREFTENNKLFRSVTNKMKRSCNTSCRQNLSRKSFPLPSIDNANPEFDNGEAITTPEVQQERIINLALYGSSNQVPHEPVTNGLPRTRLSEIRLSGNVPPAPKTLKITVNSGWNGNSSSIKGKKEKHHLRNNWPKSYGPSNMLFFKRGPKTLKCTKQPESTNASEGTSEKKTSLDVITALFSHEHQQTLRSELANYKGKMTSSADQQKNPKGRSMTKWHSAHLGKIRRLKKQKWISALFHRTRRQNCANEQSKRLKSPFEQRYSNVLSKNELSKDLSLNFKVLPESFNLADGSPLMETHPSSSTDTGLYAKPLTQQKRPLENSDVLVGVWCVSPKKKQKFSSTERADISGSSSTFQEFKKRYKEKKLKSSS